MSRVSIRFTTCAVWALAALLTAGCVQEMSDQPRLEPLEPSRFFEDGKASRGFVPGTVARGHKPHEITRHSAAFLTGLDDGELARALPTELTEDDQLKEILVRGRERYEIFCSHCHDLVGTGRGFVVQRGFPEPPTYHSERLRQAPLGHIFRVISDGRGRMPAHASQIPPADRWAIAAYVRALQFSQHFPASSLGEEDRQKLEQASL